MVPRKGIISSKIFLKKEIGFWARCGPQLGKVTREAAMRLIYSSLHPVTLLLAYAPHTHTNCTHIPAPHTHGHYSLLPSSLTGTLSSPSLLHTYLHHTYTHAHYSLLPSSLTGTLSSPSLLHTYLHHTYTHAHYLLLTSSLTGTLSSPSLPAHIPAPHTHTSYWSHPVWPVPDPLPASLHTYLHHTHTSTLLTGPIQFNWRPVLSQAPCTHTYTTHTHTTYWSHPV